MRGHETISADQYEAAVRATWSEEQFQATVIALAQANGWRVAAFRPARTLHGWRTAVQADGAGWPDLVMVRGNKAICAELKVGRNRTTGLQKAWLVALEEAGFVSCVWYPSEWDDAIVPLLGR